MARPTDKEPRRDEVRSQKSLLSLVARVPLKLNIDTHTHRVNLESWLPKALHGEINHLLVGFGQVSGRVKALRDGGLTRAARPSACRLVRNVASVR